MNEIHLSKSKYCRAIQCNKMLWLEKNKPEEKGEMDNQAVLDNGTKVGELAKGIFGNYTNIEYDENLDKMIYDTKEALKESSNIITEASFKYKNNFCSIDILKVNENSVEIYEVKSSTEIKDIYLDDISYQFYILNKLGYKVTKASIIYINNQYIRHGELNLSEFFNIEDVTDIVQEKQKEIESKIKEINEYMKQEAEPKQEIGMQCFKPYQCQFWKYCTKHLPEHNVFQIRKMHKDKALKFYYEGKTNFKDLLEENMNWKFKQQIEFEEFNYEPHIDKQKIREFMKNLYYPIYFLDFETMQTAIPEFDNSKPYQQIPFQYSLHYIEKENGELFHKEFLAESGTDPRRKLAEQLVKDIPKDVCVTAYNMMFEKGRIKELAEIFPDLSEHLMNIHEHIQDLMIPFSERMYYCKDMQGSYSIKYVLPALFPNDPELNYHNLPLIHNGGEAMNIFPKIKDMSKEEQEKARYGLLKYCELDTYAMVKVWEKLKEV